MVDFKLANLTIDELREVLIENNQQMSSLINNAFLISMFFVLIGAYIGYRYMDDSFTGVFIGAVLTTGLIYFIMPAILLIL